jgi:hypothetical protein
MSQVTTPTEPGWLPDPSGRYDWRYWDNGWTNRVASSASRADDATGATTAPASPEPASAPPPSARDAVPRVPFGDEAPAPALPNAEPKRTRRTPWAAIVGFFRSFADQPESYHSPLAREPLPPDPRGERIIAGAPGNYGHAGIVSVAALLIVVGAYLPWISGTIGLARFNHSGFDDGLGLGYTIGAVALALSALLSVRMRIFRWLTVILSFVITGFVVRDVLHTYDVLQTMNRANDTDANLGWGLWIMIVGAAIAMIGSVRLSEDQKIG